MKFNLFAASVHGKKYRERGLPCQDFSATPEFGEVQAVALADGHGGKDYFRSDTGARLAVETAFEQVKIFCRELNADAAFFENGIRNFKLSIVDARRKKVLADWLDRLNTLEGEARWQSVSDKYKARFLSADENIRARYILVAYGTTLLCAISIGTQVLIAQIGDGTCVVLNCDENLPAAIFLSNDGDEPKSRFLQLVTTFFFEPVTQKNSPLLSTLCHANGLKRRRGEALPTEGLQALCEGLSTLDDAIAKFTADDSHKLKALANERTNSRRVGLRRKTRAAPSAD